MSRTDDRACLVGGTCIKWKLHYPCLDGSSGVGINQPRWLRGHRTHCRKRIFPKSSIMDEKNEGGGHGRKKGKTGGDG